MGYYRMPSSTPSVGSDAPIPETLQEEDPVGPQIPPGAGTRQPPLTFSEAEVAAAIIPKTEASDATPVNGSGSWTFYVGNLHPRTTETELYDLFKNESGDNIQGIVIRSSRGAGLTVIPDEVMTSNDRCYASIRVNSFEGLWVALSKYDSDDSPLLHGLPIHVGKCPADMPDVPAMLAMVMAEMTNRKEPRRRTKRRAPRQPAMQKTELVIEDQRKPLAGPSRTKAQPKPRPNPTGRRTRRTRCAEA